MLIAFLLLRLPLSPAGCPPRPTRIWWPCCWRVSAPTPSYSPVRSRF